MSNNIKPYLHFTSVVSVRKKYLSLAVDISGKPEKSQKKSRKAHDKNKQYIYKKNKYTMHN